MDYLHSLFFFATIYNTAQHITIFLYTMLCYVMLCYAQLELNSVFIFISFYKPNSVIFFLRFVGIKILLFQLFFEGGFWKGCWKFSFYSSNWLATIFSVYVDQDKICFKDNKRFLRFPTMTSAQDARCSSY